MKSKLPITLTVVPLLNLMNMNAEAGATVLVTNIQTIVLIIVLSLDLLSTIQLATVKAM